MAISLTARQLDLLRFVAGYQAANGRSPSFSEMTEGLGLPKSGKGSTHRLLCALEERGAIRRLQNWWPQAIEIMVPVAIPCAPDGAPLFFISVAEGAQ